MSFTNVFNQFDFSFLRAQSPSKPLTDRETIQSRYQYWRLRTMYSMFIGYAVFYFCRKNLSASTPALIHDLGYSKTQIGTIWSCLYLAYGLSKMVNGVLGDRSNPRYFMALGLFLSALMNICFGMSSSLLALGIFWTLNGWFQGMGWPPCARLLTQWYSQEERGTKWAIWNTAHQIGGGLILIIGGFLTENYGWRSSFWVPAIFAFLTSIFLIDRLRDTPESLGLPSIEEYSRKGVAMDSVEDGQSGASPVQIAHPPQSQPQLSSRELFKTVVKNPQIWFLSMANFFVYLVRFGAMDWAPTFLVEVKHSTVATASFKAAGFEFIGIAGALFAGWISDRVFKGRRSTVNIIYMGILAFAILEFWIIPPGFPVLDALALSAVGFLVYGPQMLVGVAAADLAGKNAAATATGFTGLFGYVGSIASGIGTGWIVDRFGWGGGFTFFMASAVIGGLCFMMTREPGLPGNSLSK